MAVRLTVEAADRFPDLGLKHATVQWREGEWLVLKFRHLDDAVRLPSSNVVAAEEQEPPP